MKLFKAGIIKNHNLGKPGEYQYLGIKYDATNNLVKNLVKCNILE